MPRGTVRRSARHRPYRSRAASMAWGRPVPVGLRRYFGVDTVEELFDTVQNRAPMAV